MRKMWTVRALGGAGALLAGLLVGACAASGPQSPTPQTGTDLTVDPMRSMTSRVDSADTTEWRGAVPRRAEELLAGRFAGVQVIEMANGDVSVRIRGTTSLMGNNDPLYIIDGLETTAQPGRGLAGINPNDIAKIEVLKDPADLAIYGVRGANGVVIVTTKRGR